MQSPPGPELVIDGKRCLYFGGTSYLGLAENSQVIEAGCDALRRYGVHSATSRARYGNCPIVLEVERRAAEYFGTESSFYFSSGYMTNHILVSAVGSGCDAVLVDGSAHYCVLEAARLGGVPVLPFEYGDLCQIERLLEGYRKVLLMCDAIGPSTGVTAPVKDYLAILKQVDQATLLLDDAHGFGVLGPKGRGLLDELGLWDRANGGVGFEGVDLVVGGTLSKALGGLGGIVPGRQAFVDRVRQSSHYFDGASAPGNAAAGSSAKALEMIQSEPGLRQRLQSNVEMVRAGLGKLGLQVPEGRTANFGVSIGSAENMQRIHQALLDRGILLPHIGAYSGIPAEGVLRFAIFATHTPDQCARLLTEISAVL